MISLRISFLLSLLALSAPAGTIEQAPVTPADVAREMGMLMSKFSATFDEPVYAILELRIRKAGGTDVDLIQQPVTVALKSHEIIFTLRDMNALYDKLGMARTAAVRDVVDISISHAQAGFNQREKNPFGVLKPGQSIVTWTRKQKDSAVELEKTLPLYIKAGPFTDENPRPKDLLADYEKAPAYIAFLVKFTKEKPEEAPEPEAPKKPAAK